MCHFHRLQSTRTLLLPSHGVYFKYLENHVMIYGLAHRSILIDSPKTPFKKRIVLLAAIFKTCTRNRIELHTVHTSTAIHQDELKQLKPISSACAHLLQ